MTATFEREYVDPAGVLATAMGNMQSLPGGDVVVGWGVGQRFSQFAASGRRMVEGSFQPGWESYRAYRLDWAARPDTAPVHAVEARSDGTATVYASWNGATDVATWDVLAGPSAHALSPIRSAPRKGFETPIAVRGGAGLLAVAALDRSGRVLGRSKPAPVR